MKLVLRLRSDPNMPRLLLWGFIIFIGAMEVGARAVCGHKFIYKFLLLAL
jgi:hypothetical protein